jgi:hypothetical protein
MRPADRVRIGQRPLWACPLCHAQTIMIPVAYGPRPEPCDPMYALIEARQVAYGGYLAGPESPDYRCQTCLGPMALPAPERLYVGSINLSAEPQERSRRSP